MYAIQFFLVGLGSIVLGSFFKGKPENRVSKLIIIILAPILTWLLKTNGMIITIIFATLSIFPTFFAVVNE